MLPEASDGIAGIILARGQAGGLQRVRGDYSQPREPLRQEFGCEAVPIDLNVGQSAAMSILLLRSRVEQDLAVAGDQRGERLSGSLGESLRWLSVSADLRRIDPNDANQ
jgi:hypothetical protein